MFDDLMRAVLESPNDDAPRLVLADWLDEHGDSDRSSFIRVQIELAKVTCICDNPSWSSRMRHKAGTCRRCDLKERNWELLGPHEVGCYGENWFKWFGNELPNVNIVECSRGFPSAVSLSLAAFMGGPCEQCRGYGHDELFPYFKCKPCSGSGRITGLVDTLGRRWPITSVTLTDREPAEWSEETGFNRFVWTKRDDDLIEAPCDIPLELFKRLQAGELNRGIWARRFPTRAAAATALSNACVDLMRERAGMPAMR